MGQTIAGSTAFRRSPNDLAERLGKEKAVAETKSGHKWVRIPSYTRVVGGKPVHVPTHDRSTPHTSTGKGK
jgi:hypothetical protein